MATSGTFWARWESSTWGGRPKYYNWSGSWSKSGTTITLTNMQIYMGMVDPNAGGTGSGTDSITVSPGGSAQSVTFTWSGGNTSNTRSLNNVSFTVSGTATSKTIYCYIDGENTGSYTLSFDPAYVAPNTPTITATANNAGQVTVGYGTTSFGTPSTGTVTLYGGTTSSPTTSLDTYSSTGNKTFVHTGLTPGTTYYYRARANNGQLNSSYSTEVSATTSSVALYGSVNGQAKRVTKLYGPREELTSLSFSYSSPSSSGHIDSIDAATFLARFLYGHPQYKWKDYGELYRVTMTRDTTTQSIIRWVITVTMRDATEVKTIVTNDGLSDWGITYASYGKRYANITPSYTSKAKEIAKLYGSVSGVAKRIY